jgi:AcrR family transcriptional regulator
LDNAITRILELGNNPHFDRNWGIKMDRRVKKTKAAVQDAYFSLVMEKDTPKITITELTKRADIDRKTFYLHYESVDDIVEEAIEDRINRLRLILEQENYFENPLEFDKVFQAINLLLEQDITLCRHIAKNSIFRDFWDQVQNIMSRTIVEVYKDISSLTVEELEIYAQFYSAGIIAIYIDWLNNENHMPIERLGHIAGCILGEERGELLK